jgi:hypothetical protein
LHHNGADTSPKTFPRDLAGSNLKRGEGEEKMTARTSEFLKRFLTIEKLFKVLNANPLAQAECALNSRTGGQS